jgi:hypothetical protein
MSQQPGARAQVHHLKVTLQDFRPAVWRRLRVPSEVTLGELSDILQDTFGWDGDHLHKFVCANVEYVPELLLEGPLVGFGPPSIHEDSVRLIQVAPRPGAVLDYVYDLGDEWRHRIEVEDLAAAEPDTRYPTCTGGRGVAPEEDSYGDEYTPGPFTEDDRLAINRRFRAGGALPGRELPASAGDVDPVFAALFPWLVQGEGAKRVLRTREVAPLPELAEQATASALVRRAHALARWVGAGRALTPSKVLRPDDAVQAVAELGLAEPLLPEPPEIDVLSGDSAFRDWVPLRRADEAARRSAATKKIRSAKDLPALHGLWNAAVEAGLIEVRGSRAVAENAVDAGDGEAVETWARLLAGLMRARVQAEQEDRSYYGRPAPQEAVFPISAQILDELADRPLPVLLPALPIAATTGNVTSLTIDAVHAAMCDWTLAGVIERTGRTTAADGLDTAVRELVAGFWPDDDPSDDPGTAAQEFLRRIPRPALDAVYGSAPVRLSSLGAYGIRRLLGAHGWATTAP